MQKEELLSNLKAKPLKHWIEDLFVIFLIIINILDFMEIISADLDFIKKILSWMLLGYLVYNINLAKVTFGKKSHEDESGVIIGLSQKDINILILISYFSLIFKNLVYYAIVVVREILNKIAESYNIYLTDNLSRNIITIKDALGNNFYNAINTHISTTSWKILTNLALNYDTIINGSILFGIFLIFMTSLFLAWKYDIRAPSIMHIIHEEGNPPKEFSKKLLRFISIYLILMGFYIIVFNVFMEWLAFAVDAPLLVSGIFFYIFLMFKQKRVFNPEELIRKISSFGESFYEHFFNLFYSKEGLFLALTGLLILHLLTDVGNFIMPYLLGFHDSLYFSSLNITFFSIFQLFLYEIKGQSILTALEIAYLYFMNIIGISLLMILPAYIWYKAYISKGFKVNSKALALFYSSQIAFLFADVFSIKPIDKNSVIAGVYIKIHKLAVTMLAYKEWIIMASLIVGFLVYYFSQKSHIIKKSLVIYGIILVLSYLGYYISLFAFDYLRKYPANLQNLFQNGDYLGSINLGLFMIILLLFYISSFLLYIKEVYTEYQYVK